jgi:hypothetical protein
MVKKLAEKAINRTQLDFDSHPSSIVELLNRSQQIAKAATVNAGLIDQVGAFPCQEFDQIAHAGLLSAPLDRQLGGLGLGIEASMTGVLLEFYSIWVEAILQSVEFLKVMSMRCN